MYSLSHLNNSLYYNYLGVLGGIPLSKQVLGTEKTMLAGTLTFTELKRFRILFVKGDFIIIYDLTQKFGAEFFHICETVT